MKAKFQAVNPILPVNDVDQSVQYFIDKLGFELAFRDPTGPSNYAGVKRGGAEIHLQFQYPDDMPAKGSLLLRFIVDDPDALLAEYLRAGVLDETIEVKDQPWGTREFAFFEPNGNGLIFYRDR